jgi:hypothetical protein
MSLEDRGGCVWLTEPEKIQMQLMVLHMCCQKEVVMDLVRRNHPTKIKILKMLIDKSTRTE